MTRTLLTAIFLTLFSQTAWANDANSFFKRYNSPEYGKQIMQCPESDGGFITYSVSNNLIQMFGVDLGYAARNGNTNQYYLEGDVSMFFDFDERVYIQLLNGQEVYSTSCK
jgi:hypothetical protein